MPTPVSDSNTHVISSCFVTNISIKERHICLAVHFLQNVCHFNKVYDLDIDTVRQFDVA